MNILDICGILYVILGVLIVLTSIFMSGYERAKSPYEKDFIGDAMVLAIFWPFAIILALGFLPFFGLYKLGEWFGRKAIK